MNWIYTPSAGPDSWRRLLAKASHWKPGYSAHAIAHCWEDADGFPDEIQNAFAAVDSYRSIEPLIVIPEHQVPLPGGSRPSQIDVWVLARCEEGLVSVAIEGKAKEPFGPTLAEWDATSSPGKAERLAALTDLLGLPRDLPGDFRYQLLHRTAGAILEAQRFGASRAVMLVHAFGPSDASMRDFERFVELLGGEARADTLIGVGVRGGVELHVGWVTGDERFLRAGGDEPPLGPHRVASPDAGQREVPLVSRIHGIDFSGAADAGAKIWIASGQLADGRVIVTDCRRAANLPGSARDRDRALHALRELLAGQEDAAIGLDFPFGVPRAVVGDVAWSDFIREFANRHPTAEAFRLAAFRAAGGKEYKRVTDEESHTPFSPYNLRLYKQTYYGIRDVLSPLVRDTRIVVPPMQRLEPGRPIVMEICPASTLKSLGLYAPYKGRREDHRRNREGILNACDERGLATVAEPDLRMTILDDPGGDALDAVVAAVAVSRGVTAGLTVPANRPEYAVEGYVWV